MSTSAYHQPVLLQEVVEALNIRPDGLYVDATFGGGGHAHAILQHLGTEGRLLAFDQDEDAWKNAIPDERFRLVPENFRHLARFLKLYQGRPAEGLLADLGVSSHQFDTAERGFSTRFDAPLDMRMDKRTKLTAADILQQYDETGLQQIFEKYGELRNARTLARHLVQARRIFPMRTISELRATLNTVMTGNPQRYLAQVFQALRITVNDELNALQDLLVQSAQILKPGGRLVIITFHSLEDRVVKNFIRNGIRVPIGNGEETVEMPFIAVNKKPGTASIEEIRQNPRARSAKLRIAEKS